MVKVGQTFSSMRTLTQQDFDRFAQLSGDDNPIHVDPDFAGRTRFGGTVAHGMMLFGLICGLLGRHLPGAVQMDIDLMFPAPTFAGDELQIEAEVKELDGKQIKMATAIKDSAGVVTCNGQTVLYWEAL